MNYRCEDEYNAAMSAQAEAEYHQEMANEIYSIVNQLEEEKSLIQQKIDILLGQLN